MQAAKPTIEQRLAKAAADGKLGPEDYIRVITSVLGFDEGWFEFEQDISDAARAYLFHHGSSQKPKGPNICIASLKMGTDCHESKKVHIYTQ